MWVLALHQCTLEGVARSPINIRTFFDAHVCLVAFKHRPQPLRSHIQRFGTLGQLFKIPPLSTQNLQSVGGSGDPQNICLYWNLNILVS